MSDQVDPYVIASLRGGITIRTDVDGGGNGDFVIETGEIERVRIDKDGNGSGLFDGLVTVDELTASTFIIATISATTSYGVWIAPFACTIEQASLYEWNGTVAASNTNYWSIAIEKWHGSSNLAIATKTTQLTGGVFIPQRDDWNFDALTFDASNKALAKGDAVGIRFTPTGVPTNIVNALVSLRYKPS